MEGAVQRIDETVRDFLELFPLLLKLIVLTRATDPTWSTQEYRRSHTLPSLSKTLGRGLRVRVKSVIDGNGKMSAV